MQVPGSDGEVFYCILCVVVENPTNKGVSGVFGIRKSESLSLNIVFLQIAGFKFAAI